MTRVLAPLLLMLPLAACGADDDSGTLTVLAAASLTETFTELAATFEDEHPGVEVALVFGSSTTLAEQAGDGAPGDVLATADERSMTLAADRDALAVPPEVFASNRLVLVTPPDNPADVRTLADLDDAAVDYVACAASAPCGAIAGAVLAAAGIGHPPVSEEVDVRAVLARIVQGEADAGLVYRTDAVAAGDDVTEVAIDEDVAGATSYLIAPLRGDDAERADLAAEFVALVGSDRARGLLDEAGFGQVLVE